MRIITCGELRTSVLGFGCGSVLGRVGRSHSLRAMNAAWDEGITLFDTARSYGYGDAESVLGEFLRGKRQQAVVATKFGITPQPQSPLKRMAIPMVRAAVRMKVPGMRSLTRRGSAPKPSHGNFTVQGLRTSVESSLRQLRTDYVDILFLHEASKSAVHQQDLMAELEALMQAGKVLRVGLYAGADVIAEGMANGPATLRAMQFGADPFDPVVAALTEAKRSDMLMIANHPFGSEQRVAQVTATLKSMSTDETIPANLRDKLRDTGWDVVLEAILGVVLQSMGAHALVFSMIEPKHLRANTRAVEGSRFTVADLALIRERLLANSAHSQDA